MGIQLLNAQEDSFLMNDPDYTYTSTTLKVQVFSTLKESARWSILLGIQPQIQWNTHQLLNPFFVQGTGPEVDALRSRFTTKKNILVAAIEPALVFQYKLSKWIRIEAMAGIGMGYIDTESERLAKGFTFIENIQLGVLVKSSNNGALFIGGSIGHTSNLNFKRPNSGYNLVGVALGYRYRLHKKRVP